MTVEISLTFDEMLTASQVGCARQIDAMFKRRTPGPGTRPGDQTSDDDWAWNIRGAFGEAVVAKWLGLSWDGCFGNLKASDVAFLEVRSTRAHDYPLRLHDKDKDDCVYILVTGVGPVFQICGFIVGARGKRKEWFHDRPPPVRKPTGRPAYWVPQSALNTNVELLKQRALAHYARLQATRVSA